MQSKALAFYDEKGHLKLVTAESNEEILKNAERLIREWAVKTVFFARLVPEGAYQQLDDGRVVRSV